MDTREIIRQLRSEQEEILKSLKPELLAEFKRLEKQIRMVKKLVMNACRLDDFDLPNENFAERLPLLKHKQRIIAYMRGKRQPVTRKEIISETLVPAGSLSSILKAREFEQIGHGLWQLSQESK